MKETEFRIKPMNTKELARSYGVSRKVFHTWLQPFLTELGQRRGYYFTILQVRIIFEKLGPCNIDECPTKFIKKNL